MKGRNSTARFIVIISGILMLIFSLWLLMSPVDIAATHHRSNGFSDVLVKGFPFTDKGKIDWWLKNKAMLKEKYKIPKPASDGYYNITFWDFADGYKVTDGYDRLCFKDMKPPLNCIDKNRVFSVSYSKNRGTIFSVDDGEYCIKDGKIAKIKNE